MFCVVIVLLSFNARIRQMVDLDLESHLFAGDLHHLRKLQDSELLGELVEHTELALLGRVEARDLDAAHGVANVKESARLTTLSVNRERITQSGLRAETIQHRPEDFVIIETVDQSFIHLGFVSYGAVQDRKSTRLN